MWSASKPIFGLIQSPVVIYSFKNNKCMTQMGEQKTGGHQTRRSNSCHENKRTKLCTEIIRNFEINPLKAQ